MASWMVHLRIADALIDRIEGLDRTAFVMGNIAPDSGVPNSDWSAFSPPKSVTHYYRKMADKSKQIDIAAFRADYFSEAHIQAYSNKAYSFFLGYYVHLLSDIEWSEKISDPTQKQHLDEIAEDKQAFVERMKEDWYDLDFRFLREHPDFRAFRIYEQAKGFQNVYMKEFADDAFENRREYICGFYHGNEHGALYRQYPYLTPEQADCFVHETVESVLKNLASL